MSETTMATIKPMGIGKLGDPSIVFKRKFRWTLYITDSQTGEMIVPRMFVKTSTRPQLNIEETEINFLNQKQWIPGANNWQTTTMTAYDVSNQDGEAGQALYSYIGQLYSQSNQALMHNSTAKANYVLELWDGCGCLMEGWKMKDGFITSLKFGELDYTSSECVDIEMDVRYTNIEYISYCVGTTPPGGAPYLNDVVGVWDKWKMPDEWIIKNPIMESSSPAERILDQFLRRTASR